MNLQVRPNGLIPERDAAQMKKLDNAGAKCGNPECPGNWFDFLKDRGRPVFEGSWGCSASCVQKIVEAAVRREFGGVMTAEADGAHRHRLPLGLIMLAQGWITNPQLQRALRAQQSAGTGRIGRWLVEECGLEEDRVTRGLGIQWGCPVLSVGGFDPNAMALSVPRVLVEAIGMVPLRVAGERILYLGFQDCLDASAAFAMERMSGLKVSSGLVDRTELVKARGLLCECDFVNATLERVADVETMAGDIASTIRKAKPTASRLVRVHQFYWLRMWLEKGAMTSRIGGIPATKEDVEDRIYTLGREQ